MNSVGEQLPLLLSREWQYRSKGSVEPGSVAIFGSVSGSVCGSSIQKILFCYSKDTFCGSLDTEIVSWFWFADPLFLYRCIPYS